MNNEISILMTYHDISIVNWEEMFKEMEYVSYNIYPLNGNHITTDGLRKIKEKYGHYTGCRFDELNTQLYFHENIKDNNDYIYTTHYRRVLDVPIDFSIPLDEKIIYVSREHASIKETLMTWTNLCENDNDFQIYRNICKKLLDLNDEQLDMCMNTQICPMREMYICHKSVFGRLMGYMYDLLELIFQSFSDDSLNSERFAGFIVERFMGVFFKKLEYYEGYDVRYQYTFLVEK